MHDPAGYDEYDFVADFYDHVTPYAARRDVEFFVDAARECNGEVLEIGAGTGRVLIPTARAGVSIVGLDLSQRMLDVCRRKLDAEPAEVRDRVRLVRGDMSCFSLARRFALVTIPFRPFQHLTTVEQQLACLACVRAHLAEGGRFILDIFNPDFRFLVGEQIAQEQLPEPEFTMPDGRRVLRTHRLVRRNAAAQVNHVELIYYVTHLDGRRERLVHAFPMRYLFRYEAEHLLVRAGFRIVALYGDYDRRPHDAAARELILVAARE